MDAHRDHARQSRQRVAARLWSASSPRRGRSSRRATTAARRPSAASRAAPAARSAARPARPSPPRATAPREAQAAPAPLQFLQAIVKPFRLARGGPRDKSREHRHLDSLFSASIRRSSCSFATASAALSFTLRRSSSHCRWLAAASAFASSASACADSSCASRARSLVAAMVRSVLSCSLRETTCDR